MDTVKDKQSSITTNPSYYSRADSIANFLFNKNYKDLDPEQKEQIKEGVNDPCILKKIDES